MQKPATFKALAGAGTTLVFALAMAVAAQAQVAITINGNSVNVQPEPLIQDGRVFVPLRGVFEKLGAGVVYDNGQITAQGNGNDIALHIGSTDATVNNEPQTIDVAPFIVGASTYVPLRFISQALGANVSWDESDHVVAISMAGGEQNAAPSPSYVDDATYTVPEPPPPIPDYQTPPCQDPNDIWQAGYWSWGTAGYYWVPGVWVAPPQTNYVWTPGYWAWRNGFFGFIAGYWGTHVGFYGGINYGGGYNGNGWAGGRWVGNRVQYNTAVVNVNRTVIHNVYVDRTVINTITVNRVSYNGGPQGLAVRPTQTQIAYKSQRRLPMTSMQVQHVHYASNDRQLLSTVNHGAPPVLTAPHPFSAAVRPAGPPVTAHDRAAALPAIPLQQQHRVAPVQRTQYAQPHLVVPARPTTPVRPVTPIQSQERPVYVQPRPVPPARPLAPAQPQLHPAYAQPHPALEGQPHKPIQAHPLAPVQPQHPQDNHSERHTDDRH